MIPDFPRQVTTDMIALRLGVQVRTVYQWRRRHEDFPRPCGYFGNRPIWYWKPVRLWWEGRKPSPF